MKQTIKLTESELRSHIVEAVKRAMNEENYRKVARKGYHTSAGTKKALNYQSKYGNLVGYPLKESQLRRVINDTVRKVLKESAGHLYGHYDDSTPFTNSKETYRGIKGTTFISHGEWADPEIWYKGHEINYYDIEDLNWSTYESDCEDDGVKPTESGYNEWCKSHDSIIEGNLDDLIWAMDGCN